MNNPFIDPGVAQKYELTLNLPFIKTIRKQEQKLITALFECLSKNDTVLEIGAGTGFYTTDVAKRVGSVLALEPSMEMSKQLQKKLQKMNIGNVKIINEDLRDYKTDKKFDYVILIGVLDYIEDWRGFLNQCAELAVKGIMLTAPQLGLSSKIYSFLSKTLENTKIYAYTKTQFQEYFRGRKVEVSDTGLKFCFLKGLTLVVRVTL